MITNDGWLSWAERVPGPRDKKYTEANRAGRYIPHSAVGWYGGWHSRLFSTERLPNGRYTDYAAASVHLWIPQRPRPGKPDIIQHYPFTVSCWASGNREANTNGIAAENEGGYIPQNEPLTDFQVDVNLRAIREVSDWKGWRPYRPVGLADATLLEHHECVKLWGGAGTSCSSNRIPWTRFLTLLEEEDMTFIAWATWKERPNNIPFRSYKLFVSPDGLSKRLVLDKPEHDALAGAGLRLRKMPLSDLKSFVGGPEPDVL